MTDDEREDDTMPGVGSKTAVLPAVDPIAALSAKLDTMRAENVAMRADVCEHLHELVKTTATIADQVSANTVDIAGLKDAKKASEAVRAKLSSSDLAQDAQLAQEKAAREELAGKVDALLAIGQRIDKLADRPAAKAIGVLIVFLVGTYLAGRGIQLAPTPQVVQQVAPTVIYADGGP